MYQSPWYKSARQYAVRQFCWYILSAKHGLLDPLKTIEYYEATLNTMPVAERKAWADRVFQQIVQTIPSDYRIEILAGKKYREHLVPMLERAGYRTSVPLNGLGIGQQLQWLKQKRDAVQLTGELAW